MKSRGLTGRMESAELNRWMRKAETWFLQFCLPSRHALASLPGVVTGIATALLSPISEDFCPCFKGFAPVAQ